MLEELKELEEYVDEYRADMLVTTNVEALVADEVEHLPDVLLGKMLGGDELEIGSAVAGELNRVEVLDVLLNSEKILVEVL